MTAAATGLFLVAMCGATVACAQEPARFAVSNLDSGTRIDLTGRWLFKPGYLIDPEDKPESQSDTKGYVPVPVPSMLSRISWWLDDSEDFKKFEQDRLSALGFDTERADDGWYHVSFDLPGELPKDRHIWIEFDGVAMQCRVFCNGKPVGEHEGMFSRFDCDLTPQLKSGTNTLAVWVSMEKVPASTLSLGEAVSVNLSAAKVVSMSKGMFGPLVPNQDNRAYDLYGIWQPVRLVVRGSAKLEDVWLKTALDGGELRVEAKSLTGTAQDVLLRAKLNDPSGDAFYMRAPQLIHIGSDVSVHTLESHDLKPNLWAPAEPNLYQLDVTLETRDGQVLDHRVQQVGFRTFEVKGNQLLLNGKPYWLRGANQLPYGKNPFDPSLARKLIQLMHDGNQRFTRTHATPWNEAWLDAADEIGLAVSIEGMRPWAFAGKAPDGGKTIMPSPEIFQHWLMENADVVRRCRNHPSVFIWTVGNEMNLRDGKNLEKWKLLSEVVKQTRQLDPTRPVIASSSYVRDPEFYAKELKPAGVDDGDIDDIHQYSGWYSDSAFVIDSKFEKELKANAGKRPFIGQEMSSGYPDLDTGLPCLRYSRDLVTPQAWVGTWAYPGNDPAVYLEEHAKATKRWAEQLRWQREDKTAGFCLFSAECWYRHSFEPSGLKPYPVYDAVKYAFAPIGVAIETPQRRFWAGEEIATNVYVTNDDERFRDHSNITVYGEIVIPGTSRSLFAGEIGKIETLPYYAALKLPVRIRTTPIMSPRVKAQLVIRLLSNGSEIGRTVDTIELFRKSAGAGQTEKGDALASGIGPELRKFLDDRKVFESVAEDAANPRVLLIGSRDRAQELAPGKPLRAAVESGATAIVFGGGKELVSLFPDALLDIKQNIGEFADWTPVRGTKLAKNLAPMDIQWWAREDDTRAFVSSSDHRLKPGGPGRVLLQFIPAHSYIAPNRVPEQYRSVLSEIRLGKGRVWICGLDLEASVNVDPAAAMFAENLLRAAADPGSTDDLPPMPTHEQLLAGQTPHALKNSPPSSERATDNTPD